MVSQQSDPLLIANGSDLDAQQAWETQPSTGLFTFYSSTTPANSNSIPGIYHKPGTGGPSVDAALPRAFLTSDYVVSPTSETKSSGGAKVRISSTTTNKWPSGTNNNIEALIIARASGTDFATHKWYEVGVTDLDSQTAGKLVIRRVVAGVSTELSSATFASLDSTFKFPSYNNGTPLNAWTRLTCEVETLGSMVRITARAEIEAGLGSVSLQYDDGSADRITTSGYWGLAATGHANAAGSLWIHFKEFLVTFNDLLQSAIIPPDPTSTPTIEATPNYTRVPLANEGTDAEESSVIIIPIGVVPDSAIDITETFPTATHKLESGDVWTRAKFQKAIKVFDCTWSALGESDAETLELFHANYSEGIYPFSLSVPNPIGGGSTTYYVKFVDETLEFEYVTKGSQVYKTYRAKLMGVRTPGLY